MLEYIEIFLIFKSFLIYSFYIIYILFVSIPKDFQNFEFKITHRQTLKY